MNTITGDQYHDILGVLTTQEQVDAFNAVFQSRKHTVAWQKNQEIEKLQEEKAAATVVDPASPETLPKPKT
jgi:hypothetical protein